jgi:hypothetical protein
MLGRQRLVRERPEPTTEEVTIPGRGGTSDATRRRHVRNRGQLPHTFAEDTLGFPTRQRRHAIRETVGPRKVRRDARQASVVQNGRFCQRVGGIVHQRLGQHHVIRLGSQRETDRPAFVDRQPEMKCGIHLWMIQQDL